MINPVSHAVNVFLAIYNALPLSVVAIIDLALIIFVVISVIGIIRRIRS